MREFRTPSSTVDDSSWDWLLEFITRPRIEKTLADFPLHTVHDSGIDSSEVEYTDERYSPDLVVRLTLAAMLQLEATDSAEAVSRFAKALCDKGVVGLALAALCCQLRKTRKACLALLGLFEYIVSSESARKLQTWKDRPQQLMLLRSVRYGCCIQSASADASSDTFLATSIPTFTAIYLARSSMILSQPSHPLYGPINRSLLSSESDAGAFQDLSRVPGFLVLFCSTSIDVEQLRYERGFALRLLRDGYITPKCFSALSQCRAPELLMAAVYTPPSYVSFHERLNEQLLIVDVFEKIIVVSVDEAKFSDFIGRVGFFSWLRCLLMGSELSMLQCYTAMLRLLSLTLSKNIQLSSSCIDLSQISGLANGILNRTITHVSTTASNNSTKAIQEIIGACCGALVSIDETISTADERFPDLGIDVGAAEDFVDVLVAVKPNDEAVYCALCRLLCHNRKSGETKAFTNNEKLCTKLLLNTLSNSSPLSAAGCRAVLGCVSVLLSEVECSDEETRQELLLCRRKCSKDEVARNHWLDCYSHFQKGS